MMTLLPALCLFSFVLFVTLSLIAGLAACRVSGNISAYEYELEARERAARSVNGDKTS